MFCFLYSGVLLAILEKTQIISSAFADDEGKERLGTGTVAAGLYANKSPPEWLPCLVYTFEVIIVTKVSFSCQVIKISSFASKCFLGQLL